LNFARIAGNSSFSEKNDHLPNEQNLPTRICVEPNNLNAFCTCPAGDNGQYCKHRFGILSGNTKSIVSENQGDVSIIQSWLPGSDLEKALKEMAEAEHESDLARKRLSLAKKMVAKAMRS